MECPKYYTIAKQIGETPLQALERLRTERSIPKHVPLAYAGRLDPMASGQLLILVGDECKNQERYHAFDKEYECEVLLGATSDTHDVLGIVEPGLEIRYEKLRIQEVLKNLLGKITLPYPHFSAKTVHGKPLHMWTLEGKLDSITIPEKTSTIYSIQLLDIRTIDATTLYTSVMEKVHSVPPVTDERKALGRDFRRTDVCASWKALHDANPLRTYTVLTIRVAASSGTYMRTLSHVIGKQLQSDALALSIHRTKIGKYFHVPFVGGFFWKTF